MGASGFGTLAGHFADRTVVTYDPRGVERSTQGRPVQRVDARPARRRPPSRHRGARRRAGRPLRQQWRRGQRTRPGAEASGAGPDARRARAAAGGDPARPRGRDGGSPEAIGDTYQRSGFGPAMAQFIVCVGHQRADHRPEFAASRRPTRRCSGCRPRTTAPAPTRCWPRTSSPARTTSPTSTRCGRPRPGSCSPPARSRRDRWPTAARSPSPSGSAPTPVIFPSGHGGFLGGEYGQPGEPDAFAAKLREVLAEA